MQAQQSGRTLGRDENKEGTKERTKKETKQGGTCRDRVSEIRIEKPEQRHAVRMGAQVGLILVDTRQKCIPWKNVEKVDAL